MTFGQLFTTMHPDVNISENGTCVWLFFDEVNHYTVATEWWNEDITGYAEALLKQEKSKPVENIRISALDTVGDCPFCGMIIKKRYHPLYCGVCGKWVKWDE